MEQLRFIDLETHTAAENMAIDEAIMLSLEKGEVSPTFRLYRWNPSAVTIGTFQSLKTDGNVDFCFLQSMKTEVDVEFCRAHGIDIVRRVTGGAAVYHDREGDITYSIILPQGHRLAPPDIPESYKMICGGIVRSLKILGIDAAIKQANDVHVGGKKISGSAQTRRHGCMLQHGSILLDLDVTTMFSILKVPPSRIREKVTLGLEERMTSVRQLLGKQISFDSMRNALADGFSEALKVELVPGSLTREEKRQATQLLANKYVTEIWNFLR